MKLDAKVWNEENLVKTVLYFLDIEDFECIRLVNRVFHRLAISLQDWVWERHVARRNVDARMRELAGFAEHEALDWDQQENAELIQREFDQARFVSAQAAMQQECLRVFALLTESSTSALAIERAFPKLFE
jgi:hypothetical protein